MDESDPLSPAHRAMLQSASGISAEIIAVRGYRTVTSHAELRRLGFSDTQARVPALILPVWGVHGEVVLYQLRPDQPRVRDGNPVKYETPTGAGMALDVPPSIRAMLGDPSLPLWVTEGLKKGDCVATHGCCVVTLLGVWNWRGRNTHGGLTVLADWEHVALKGRQVYILFDSDIMLKPGVHAALVRIKAFLEHRGASVAVVYLPAGASGEKVGVDDFLVAGHSVNDLVALASPDVRPLPADPGEGDGHVRYRIADGGFEYLRPTRDGLAWTPLTNFTATIVADVAEDDGAEVRRFFEMEASLHGRTFRFSIPTADFAAMNWPVERLGARAVVFAGMGIKDHVRAAVQVLSSNSGERRVFSHTGWREINGQHVFLHAGGAIGPDGPVPDVEVHLPDALSRLVLPAPPSGEALAKAVRASLSMLEVAPDHVSVPVLGATIRAALGGTDFGVHVAGDTGTGKTEIAALGQQHLGAGMDARHLPGSWSSTGNSLEGLAFAAKDALLVVDDFAPTGSTADVQRTHREADRVFRAQGNRAGRQRMRSDGSLRPAKPPRGLILSTGEDVPRGQSLRARILVLELARGELDWDRLTACQADAAAGRYAEAMAGFIQWLASRYNTTRQQLQEEVAALRVRVQQTASHPRTPGILAELAAGFGYYLRFAAEVGAVTDAEATYLRERCWRALLQVAGTQTEHQAASEPARRFIELLASAVTSGRAHVADPKGIEPKDGTAWGWRFVTIGAGDNERVDWQPRGDLVGWLDGENLYLDADASYAVVQHLGREQGASLPVTLPTLKRRLKDSGHLASTEMRGGVERLEVRRTLQGQRRSVLHLHAVTLFPEEVAQVAHVAHVTDGRYLDDRPRGPSAGPLIPPLALGMAQDSGPATNGSVAGARRAGPNGPLGPVPGTTPTGHQPVGPEQGYAEGRVREVVDL